MKVLFCQVSNKLLTTKEENYANQFYNTWYHKHFEDGYVRPEHFWEIPRWIAELSYCIEDKELHIIEDISKSIQFINDSDADVILFSVLSITKPVVDSICSSVEKPICVGGYTKPDSSNIQWFNSVQEFCTYFNIPYYKGVDYSLFKGIETIPRLQLSQGCVHRCKFCTISNEVVENDFNEIRLEALNMYPLKFKLVYIDDKTFGQCDNYKLLSYLYRKIKSYNHEFKGFIIQTTASQVPKIDFKGLHVFVVELGVESFNDFILKSMKKPAPQKSILEAVRILQELEINIIPNIIVGLPEETEVTYQRTLDFIKELHPYGINITNLAVYEGTELSEELKIVEDSQKEVSKSYYSSKQNRLNAWYYHMLYALAFINL